MLIDLLLLLLLVACAVMVIEMKDLLSATVVFSSYSLVMAVVWTRLNAVDVAFTEATVGAGVTTVLLLATLSKTRRGERFVKGEEYDNAYKTGEFNEKGRKATKLEKLSIVLVIVTGFLLAYGTIDMPSFGDPKAPANLHLSPDFTGRSYKDTGSVNVVTAILASYRGYDTLGETTVIFTAGICVILILRRAFRKED